jgi:release factor glutamine methyltransferase
VTIDQALARARAILQEAGVPDPDLDAELLLRHVLGFDRARVIAEGRSPLPSEAEPRFEALLQARARRQPLQHLLGRQAFWKHDFLVGPDVLIPRPETELVVEESLRLLEGLDRPVVADVGTGSGCIALSLAGEREDAEVHAIDVSGAALVVARANAEMLGLTHRVAFYEGDLLAPVAERAGRIDLVASNPPYADPSERETLAPEVRDHEPGLALFPPGDAYSIYRRLLPEARVALRPGGGLVLEIGLGMADEVRGLAEAVGFTVEIVRPDLQGIPRVVVARR